MAIRNRKSAADAMFLRLWIAAILDSTTHFERLTYKDIQRRLGDRKVPTETIKRHVVWLRREYRKDGLKDFLQRARLARQGYPAPYDGKVP